VPRRATLRIYADSCIYLSVIKRDADLIDDRPRWKIARSLFAAAERGEVIICASTLVQAEVTGHGDVRGAGANSDAQKLVADWFLSDYIEWCDVDRLITRRVPELSQQYGLRGADAIHLATAIRLRAAYLISNDNGFARAHGQTVEGVQVIKPQVVWQETLEDAADG